MNMPTSVAEGGPTLAADSPASPVDALGRRPIAMELLTPREREVFGLLGEGMTAVAIGHRLGISPRTVEKHLENVYAKIGVGDRLSAVLWVYTTAARASM